MYSRSYDKHMWLKLKLGWGVRRGQTVIMGNL
uniref:Uncharacterized protein n=1 Tax=Anguilla anguilla TaxID=7936 RepID=A0A0E9S0M1_ANGAN